MELKYPKKIINEKYPNNQICCFTTYLQKQDRGALICMYVPTYGLPNYLFVASR